MKRPSISWLLLTRRRALAARTPGVLAVRSLSSAMHCLRQGRWKGMLVDGSFDEHGINAWGLAFAVRDRFPGLMVAVMEDSYGDHAIQ
jgi:hypothetical protein